MTREELAPSGKSWIKLNDTYLLTLEHLGVRVVYEITPPVIGQARLIEAVVKTMLGSLGRLGRQAQCEKEGHLLPVDGFCSRCLLVVEEAAWTSSGRELTKCL